MEGVTVDFGFIRVGAATPKIQVGNCTHNADEIISIVQDAHRAGVSLLVFPELSLTGYTCSDLFLNETLTTAASKELVRIAQETAYWDVCFTVGLPLPWNNRLYNVAALVSRGKILAFIPKTAIPNYAEFYEGRHFAPGFSKPVLIDFPVNDTLEQIPFGTNIIFKNQDAHNKAIHFAIELCEDMWIPSPPSVRHCLAGAHIILNLSASNEIVGKKDYRKTLISALSGRLSCGYVYADAGLGESTTDMVFAGHNIIAENGSILAESALFSNQLVYTEIDVERLMAERRKTTTYCQNSDSFDKSSYIYIPLELHRLSVSLQNNNKFLHRAVDPLPFIPQEDKNLANRCQDVLTYQTYGLVKRLEHTKTKTAVLGLSGGLDSTLALIVTVEAFKKLQIPLSGIHAITMPCFGTTDRTLNNAKALAQEMGVSLQEISIKKAVLQHFTDIGHDPEETSVTYENSQARERTQILMDIANKVNGLVIGTGDMSELALGWATYNGDHMSMYGVNASVPKTLIRHLVHYFGNKEDGKLKDILLDILDTPVSPELLPPKEGEIAQKTESIIGPYELHDFYLYYTIRWGFAPKKIYFLAKEAFHEKFPSETILYWLKTFYRRFFSQQYKRSCLPDGPKVGSVSLSPRGDWRMPSDADGSLWQKELDSLT